MNYDHRIIKAFKSNNITKVLLIDDAYDPPEINEQIIPQFTDFLESEAGKATFTEQGIKVDDIDAAISAANESRYNSDELNAVYDILYKKFVYTLEDKFDPGGIFKQRKGVALDGLSSLCNLLHECVNEGEVSTAGLKDGLESYKNSRPQILFVDYYLSHDVPATGEVNQQKETDAQKASIDLLKQIIAATDEDDIPAIVLMSSYEVEDVNKYRHATKSDKIISLRFQFLKKEHVFQEGSDFQIDQAAADVLLDTSQGYLFGKVLQQALAQWKRGAASALSDFMREVGDLDIKDIAYLLRFELWEEGQPLSEYLQWFFGECLKGFIDEKVEWQHNSFSKLDDEDDLAKSIEGAFDGPTRKIAEFFHRVRVDRHRIITRRRYQIGDLYVEPSENKIRAILTPDCDLVERNGGSNVDYVLTMGGVLNTFDKDGSAADDFFLQDDNAYSVRWNPKDLKMFPIRGEGELHTTNEFEFLGTLRPLYAQEMQRRALTDLSRVGLPVAPALGINVTASVWIRKNDANTPFHEIEMTPPALATLILSRAEYKSGHRVLLRRHFFNELMMRLREINTDEMCEEDAEMLNNILNKEGMEKIYKGFLITGGLTKAKGPFRTSFRLGNKPSTELNAPWLQIILKVSDDAMEELQVIDPLDYDLPDENTD